MATRAATTKTSAKTAAKKAAATRKATAKAAAAASAAISIQPTGPIIAGNSYTAYATLPLDEGPIWLKVITSGTGRLYPTYTQDDVTRASFFVEREGSYMIRFVRDDKTLSELGFTV
jgi:hypothetical protein